MGIQRCIVLSLSQYKYGQKHEKHENVKLRLVKAQNRSLTLQFFYARRFPNTMEYFSCAWLSKPFTIRHAWRISFFRLPFRTLPIRKIKQDFQNPKRILIYILMVLSLFSIALRQDSNNPILRSPQNFHSQKFCATIIANANWNTNPFPYHPKKPRNK